ncbi:universal stress protein [Nitrospirillum iridis]|uniref:Nucleotide-binding universal stress UspA family protein n=1 Tax=Nitrospirillum iridis TaxID=765888 RepID=A0A7X0B404_9PROT|nr:universal stress protein [Nitrospirillum iridis]MBB6254001.1 nucleotide-binding universal stress UspA family protein [Nitrospirillum iridis]
MSYRKILTVLTGGGGDRAALAAAFALASPVEGGAHILALVPNPDPREAVPALGEGVSGPLVEQIMAMVEQESANHRTRARQAFDAAMAAARATPADQAPGPGGLTGEFREALGNQEDTAVCEARLADVSVMTQVDEAAGGEALLMLEAILLDSARPLLVVPKTFAPGGVLGRHVAVAWNGSRESTQAVVQSLPLLAAAETVTVIAVETSKTRGAAGRDLADYLAWRGIKAQVRQPAGAGQPVGATLLTTAGAAGADLLVLGGYGHSRLREMILGGVTRHVLYNAAIPVLLAH